MELWPRLLLKIHFLSAESAIITKVTRKETYVSCLPVVVCSIPTPTSSFHLLQVNIPLLHFRPLELQFIITLKTQEATHQKTAC